MSWAEGHQLMMDLVGFTLEVLYGALMLYILIIALAQLNRSSLEYSDKIACTLLFTPFRDCSLVLTFIKGQFSVWVVLM